MFGTLLLVVAQLIFQSQVLSLVPAPPSSTGDGMYSNLTIDDLHEQLR